MTTDISFNLDDALARVDQDQDLFVTLAELFIEQAPQDMAATQAALDAGDAAALARAAHRMKGAVLQFAAPGLFEATSRLESLGKAGTLDCAAAVCAQVDEKLQQLVAALRAYIEKRPAA